MVHISPCNLNDKTLKPRIPSNYLTDNGFEENNTPRISFSQTIDGALISLNKNLIGHILFVHRPQPNQNLNIINNKIIIKNDHVPDAQHTQELWVLNDVKLKLTSTIQAISSKKKKIRFMYGKKDGSKCEVGVEWAWNWKRI